MTAKFRTDQHEETHPAKLILGALLGQGQAPADCRCLECTAERMAADPDKAGLAPPDDQMAEIVKRNLLQMLTRVERAAEACGKVCTRIIESPTRPEHDNAIYSWRIEQFNACVGCAQTLFRMLPQEIQTEFGSDMPEMITWEEALARLEIARSEVADAVQRHKIAASMGSVGEEAATAFGAELAKLMKEALREGKGKEGLEDVLAGMIRVAADRAKDSMREASAEASP